MPASIPPDAPTSSSSNASACVGVVVSVIDWRTEQDAYRALATEFLDFLRIGHAFDAHWIVEEVAEAPNLFCAAEGGAMFLARVEGQIAGCFGLRRHDEAKRMFVRPAYRGLGLGTRLLDRVLAEARTHHYRRVLLDSLRSLPEAHRLYYQRGFMLIPPFNDLSPELVLHMGRDLA